MAELRLVAASNRPDQLLARAVEMGGMCWVDERDGDRKLPFKALLSVVTDRIEDVLDVGDEGVYVAVRRIIRARPAAQVGTSAPDKAAGVKVLPGLTALFPMMGHPDLTRAQADAHWRDRHAPLALKHHVGMSSYDQLAVMHTIAGPARHGFAFCRFDSEHDMRERFFDNDDGRRAIEADVASFADTKRSPRRLVATEYSG